MLSRPSSGWAMIITVPQMISLLRIHSGNEALVMAVPMGLMGGLAVGAIYELSMRSCPPGLLGTLMMVGRRRLHPRPTRQRCARLGHLRRRSKERLPLVRGRDNSHVCRDCSRHPPDPAPRSSPTPTANPIRRPAADIALARPAFGGGDETGAQIGKIGGRPESGFQPKRSLQNLAKIRRTRSCDKTRSAHST